MTKRSRSKRILSSEDEVQSDSVGPDENETTSRPTRRSPRYRSVSGESLDISNDDSHDDSDTEEPPRKAIRRTFSHVAVTGPAFPRSMYEGFAFPLELSTEADAVADLKAAFQSKYATAAERPDYTYFTLDDFSIYLPNRPRHGYELATLDRLQNRNGYTDLLFDGFLSFDRKQHFVKGIRFRTMAVDGYGDPSITDLHDHISLQSALAERQNVWYLLRKPSPEYWRFHEPFIWLAHFTKYFVDYLLETESVTLNHFRKNFSRWLWGRCSQDPAFTTWLQECKSLKDFRTTVAAHVGYLWKECYSIDDIDGELCNQPIWGEVDPLRLKAIPEHENVETKTIVTPFAYECFRRMYFHAHLEERQISRDGVLKAIAQRKKVLKLSPFGASQPPEASMHTPRSLPDTSVDNIVDVREGDVICVKPDSNGHWKTTSSTWHAYVQAVRQDAGNRVLDVLWLYEPCDTTLGTAFYPFQNELFMSDNCNCGRKAIDIGRVIGKAEVAWYVKDPSEQSGLFVRQTFHTIHDEDMYDFVSLQQSDFRCGCTKRITIYEECRQKYAMGDSVLVRVYNRQLREDVLEPAFVEDFKLDKQQVVLRRLRRKTDHDRSAPSNQLLWTDELFRQQASRIIRKCNVQFLDAQTLEAGLPTPYNYGGAGDFYFIFESDDFDTASGQEGDIFQASTSDEEQPSGSNGFDKCPPPVDAAFDPLKQFSPKMKLRGMGIFCGGGNLDRGLEDGGAVDFHYAVDWAERAIHSYRANVENPKKVQFFWGSVNDYLAEAMSGSSATCIARLGDVDVISAGSPCPGFSNMQPDKQSAGSLRNASLVASVVSYADFYSPRYCVLENVVSMTYGMGENKNENVFAQVLAALVAIGYQVQQFHMTAWNYGSAQSRPRVFIVASAPGLEPLLQPPHTHAHPAHSQVKKVKLGKSSNGLAFGVQRDDYTPFQLMSAAEVTADLPSIADSQAQLCPAFPDHRTPSEESAESRARIAAVPVRPRGLGLVQAAAKKLLSGEPLEYYEKLNRVRKCKESKTYSRVYPERLFPTVTTALQISCGVVGRTLHWNEHRLLTVMELRRAQGFLDHEVIIGSPNQQVVIIGNSVDRKVAFALGLSLKRSWVNSCIQSSNLPFSESSPGSMSDHARPGTPTQQVGRRLGHRFTLSLEERQSVLADRKKGFKTIRQILEARENTIADTIGSVLDTEEVDQVAEVQQPAQTCSSELLSLSFRPHSTLSLAASL